MSSFDPTNPGVGGGGLPGGGQQGGGGGYGGGQQGGGGGYGGGQGGGGYGPRQGGGGGGQGGGGYGPQGGGRGGYGPQGGGGGGQEPVAGEGSSRKPWLIVAGIAAVLLLIGVGVLVSGVLSKDDGGDGAGEVFLAPASSLGPDPYSATPLAPTPDPALAQPVSETGASVNGSGAVTASNGGKPGLYGGTMNMASCDPQKIVDFLAANPAKAAAWVAALNADPEVKLPDGQPLTVAAVPQYMASLTPITLLTDTRVTNHGFKNGKATKLQSVLQKGSAVLVDNKGVPRVKCYCGNPLLPPAGVSGTPKYTGDKWNDFDASKVGAVQQSTTVINVFVLTDPKTGQQFNRPAGSTGTNDTPAGTAVTTTSGPTTSGPATTAPATTTTGAPTTTAPATTAPATTAAPTTDTCSPNYLPPGATRATLYVQNDSSAKVTISQTADSCGGGNVSQVPLNPGEGYSYEAATFPTYAGQKFTSQTDTGTAPEATFTVSAGNGTWTIK